jgi:CheY-like chemotaxis protein
MNSLSDSAKPARADTVLVLDDDVLVRMPICQYLRDCGYRVLEAASADEAATILQKQEIQVDVVLTDIEMPGAMNGFGFAKWARSVRPELHIVLAGTPERQPMLRVSFVSTARSSRSPMTISWSWTTSSGFSPLGHNRAEGDATIQFADAFRGRRLQRPGLRSSVTPSVAQWCVILCATCCQSLSKCCPSSAVIFICCDTHLA